jgi:DNA mismatch repair protein MutL
MARIQQLPPLVVSKIAAGEVIERPASVVKELLENAVDAGSRRIDVEVEQGGADLIRVVDDGSGIEPEDLALAFASHATSKLRDADDLYRIDTLGFRGEALASIGGVAQVTLQSRQPDQVAGAELICHGGQIGTVRAWNGAPGTRIEVRHLFYNTPVRRKFLRTISTEMGHISEAFTRLALAQCRPVREQGLHLTLRHNGKTVYEAPASMLLLDRINQFFGNEVSGALYSVETKHGTIRLTGYVADPSCERGTARMQYLFLNGRWIRDRSLAHALQEAYRGLLMTGRYAVAFLFLEVPPDQVDVNVHPTKAEVRFRDGQAIHHLVYAAVRDRLRVENLTARLQVPSTIRPTGEPQTLAGEPAPALDRAPWALTPPPVPPPELPFSAPLAAAPAPATPVPAASPAMVNGNAPALAQGNYPPPRGVHIREGETPAEPARQEFRPPESTTRQEPRSPHYPSTEALQLAPTKVIQLYDTYLVVETDAGMLVIDQHALHERILFERFKQQLRTGPLESQRLLIPEPVDLTAEQAARVLEHREALQALGLGVEDFGGNTVLVTSYPVQLGRRSPQAILKAVVDHLTAKDRLPSREVLFNDLLSLMACHSAVRAGDRLTPEEMASLVAQRGLADDTHHCPHGRPTALLFSRQDLERQFGRI